MALSNDRIGPYCGMQTAALLLDRHPVTVSRLVKNGTLKSEFLGNKRVFVMADVVKLADRLKKKKKKSEKRGQELLPSS